eukprot:TRINITY_DN15433_c0_g1_i1.p1 TRINITY_DN15433_c0_g1~~TRINITY_DN15433_c0_g1_i1.p1  ORF type:complete len:320 (+),score=48.29 TRINITY_DN15433_c0_g1_i1:38-997(+)
MPPKQDPSESSTDSPKKGLRDLLLDILREFADRDDDFRERFVRHAKKATLTLLLEDYQRICEYDEEGVLLEPVLEDEQDITNLQIEGDFRRMTEPDQILFYLRRNIVPACLQPDYSDSEALVLSRHGDLDHITESKSLDALAESFGQFMLKFRGIEQWMLGQLILVGKAFETAKKIYNRKIKDNKAPYTRWTTFMEFVSDCSLGYSYSYLAKLGDLAKLVGGYPRLQYFSGPTSHLVDYKKKISEALDTLSAVDITWWKSSKEVEEADYWKWVKAQPPHFRNAITPSPKAKAILEKRAALTTDKGKKLAYEDDTMSSSS